MNRTLLATALLLTFVVASAHAGQPKPNKNPPPAPTGGKTETASIPVTGMMCNNCERGVAATFKKMDGVLDCTANENDSVAKVKFDPSKISIEKLVSQFKETCNKRFSASKPGEKPAEPAYNYTGKEETMKGHFVAKDGGGAGVICRFNTKRHGEERERAINVIASGDLAKQINEMYGKGLPGIKLTGVVSAEGIKVSKVDR